MGALVNIVSFLVIFYTESNLNPPRYITPGSEDVSGLDESVIKNLLASVNVWLSNIRSLSIVKLFILAFRNTALSATRL